MTDSAAVPGRGWVPAAVALICLATLTPQPSTGGQYGAFFSPWPTSVSDASQNIVLYAPLGFLLGLRYTSFARACLIGAPLSLAIELIQFIIPGRDPATADVVANTIGTVVGWIVSRTWAGRRGGTFLIALEHGLAVALRPTRRVASALSFAWALVAAGVMTGTEWLLAPTIPAPYYYLVSSPTIDRVDGPLHIGRDEDGGSFRGLIDEVRIYAAARDQGAIASDMMRPVSSDRGQEPSPVAGFAFDSDPSVRGNATGPFAPAILGDVRFAANGRSGGALAFESRTAEVRVPRTPAVDFSHGVTFEAWVYPTDRGVGSAPVIADSRDAFYLRASSEEGTLVASAGGRFGGAPRQIRLRRPIPARQWSHLAATYDGRVIRLFLNGRLAASRVQWSSHHPGNVSIDGEPLPFGTVTDPTGLRTILLGRFALAMTLNCGPEQPMEAPIFTLVGVGSIDVLNLTAIGSDVALRPFNKAQRFGLASPGYRFPGALADCATKGAIPLTLRGPLSSPRLEGPMGSMEAAGPGAGSAWTMVVDSQLMPEWFVVLVSTCFLAALLVPFGFWARIAPPTMVGGVVLAATLLFVSRADRLPLLGSRAVTMAIGVAFGAIAACARNGQLSVDFFRRR